MKPLKNLEIFEIMKIKIHPKTLSTWKIKKLMLNIIQLEANATYFYGKSDWALKNCLE